MSTGGEGMMPDLHTLFDALQQAYRDWGYPIVFLGAVLENTVLLGLILPGGTLVMLGAVYAQQGELALPLVLLFGWVGMALGTSFDYALGRWGLRGALAHPIILAKLTPRLAEVERYLERYGAWTFLVAHFIGHIRSFVAITAGVSRLPGRRFLLYEGTAALAWNAIFIGTGYLLGRNINQLQWIMNRAGLALGLALLVSYVLYRLYRRIRRRHGPEQTREKPVAEAIQGLKERTL